MVMLGTDVHTHTAVGVDQVGAQEAVRTVRATDAGHRQLVRWARTRWPQERTWAVQDCRHVSTRLERALLAAGERVVRVQPTLMAGARDSARTRGKSDPIAALAIARAALREPDLPIACHDEPSRELTLLVDHREDLAAERTRTQNRLRGHLHELDPELDVPPRGLDRLVVLDRLLDWVAGQPTGMVARLAAELLADTRAATLRINALERGTTERVQQLAPELLTLLGVGGLIAAKIVGETANPRRVQPAPAHHNHHDRLHAGRGLT